MVESFHPLKINLIFKYQWKVRCKLAKSANSTICIQVRSMTMILCWTPADKEFSEGRVLESWAVTIRANNRSNFLSVILRRMLVTRTPRFKHFVVVLCAPPCPWGFLGPLSLAGRSAFSLSGSHTSHTSRSQGSITHLNIIEGSKELSFVEVISVSETE